MSTTENNEINPTTGTIENLMDRLAPNNPAPQPNWAPAKKRRKRNTTAIVLSIVVALLVIAMAVVTVLAVTQHSKAVDTREELKDTKSELSLSQGTLATTQDELASTKVDLSSTQATVGAQQTQLAACTAVNDLSQIQQEEIVLALQSGSAALDDDFTEVLDILDDLKVKQQESEAIVRDAGFGKDQQALWDACSGGTGVNS